MHPSLTPQMVADLTHHELIALANRRKAYLTNALNVYSKPVPTDVVGQAIRRVCNHTGVVLSELQLLEILTLHPGQRSGIVAYGLDLAETALLDAVACFFLGCSWPMTSNQGLRAQFVESLQVSASVMGYQVNPWKTI